MKPFGLILSQFVLAFVVIFTPAARALDTMFLEEGRSVSGLGASWMQGFTISGTKTFVLRFASTYKADAAIISASQVSNFKNNQGFSGYGLFDDSYGTKTVTLGAGSYYLAMRSQVSGSNYLQIELDYYPEEQGYEASFSGPSGAEKVGKNGGKLWHGFTWVSGSANKAYVDGVNSGVTYWVIPASDLNAFKNGGSFSYYYTSSLTNEPGLTWLNLPTGSYYLAFLNSDSVDQTVTYHLWEMIPSGSGGSSFGGSPDNNPTPTPTPFEDPYGDPYQNVQTNADALLQELLDAALADYNAYKNSNQPLAIYLYYEGYGDAWYQYWQMLGNNGLALYYQYDGLAQAVLWAYNDISGYYGNEGVALYHYYAASNIYLAYYYNYVNLAAAWYYGYIRYYEWTGNPVYQQQALAAYAYYMNLASQMQ